jgi:hypothetical protein
MTLDPSVETRQALAQIDMIAPFVGDPRLLIQSPARNRASAADLAPQPPRPGSLFGLDCPSRIGARLHYRDGTVTDLHGNPLKNTEGAP